MQQTFNNRHIWNVAYPIFLGLLAQNIINVTDTAFLGHVGETALGGAAMGGLLYICIYTMAFGFSIGSQILIARRNGEGNYHMIGEIMWQGSAFSFAMAVIMLVLMFMFAEPMIRLFVNSESVYNATYEFFIWRMWGLLFSFINVMFRALYIGITNTKVLTMNAIVMALVNVFLDYAMIFGKCGFPEMGIKGAAIASVIAEASSLVFYIIYTRCKIDIGKYRLNRIGRFRPSIVLRILHISSFTMMQYFLSMAIWFVFFIAIAIVKRRTTALISGAYRCSAEKRTPSTCVPCRTLRTPAKNIVRNKIHRIINKVQIILTPPCSHRHRKSVLKAVFQALPAAHRPLSLRQSEALRGGQNPPRETNSSLLFRTPARRGGGQPQLRPRLLTAHRLY